MEQREIKFRAWDTVEKKMRYDALMIGNIGLGEGSVVASDEVQTDNPLIWLQYINLKDRNEKEIYEGDLINFGGLKPIEIVWRDGGFKSKLIPFENSEPIHLTQEGLSAFGEIIGNIYENPPIENKKNM